jgi:hypothetical protein
MNILKLVPVVCAIAFAFPAHAAPDVFNGYNVNLVGSASMKGSDLQLTNSYGQAGAAWLQSAISTTQSFSTIYSFSLANTNGGYMADGISFAFQNVGSNAVGEAGGSIGYNGLGAVGSIVQTWYNNTAGINTNGNAYATKAAPTFLASASLVTGTETVTYNATSHQLSVIGSVNVDGHVFQVSDSTNIDLSAKFGSSMYAGFTGGTGGATADQRITSFAVTAPVPEPETYAMLLAGLGVMGAIARRRNQTK